MNLIDAREKYVDLVSSNSAKIPDATFVSTKIFESNNEKYIVLTATSATKNNPEKIVDYTCMLGDSVFVLTAEQLFDKSKLENAPIVIQVSDDTAFYVAVGYLKGEYVLRSIGADKFKDPIFKLDRTLYDN